MVGGAATSEGATFARLAAKVPARRVGKAVERLLDWYRRDRSEQESPQGFFARVKVTDVKTLLADLEAFSSGEGRPTRTTWIWQRRRRSSRK